MRLGDTAPRQMVSRGMTIDDWPQGPLTKWGDVCPYSFCLTSVCDQCHLSRGCVAKPPLCHPWLNSSAWIRLRHRPTPAGLLPSARGRWRVARRHPRGGRGRLRFPPRDRQNANRWTDRLRPKRLYRCSRRLRHGRWNRIKRDATRDSDPAGGA